MLTAVITHYYEQRLGHLKKLVESLLDSTLTPDRIVIWNNDRPFSSPSAVEVIQSPENLGSQARFVAAQQVEGDVLFLDNDLYLAPRTVEQMVKASRQFPLQIITLQGCQVEESYAARQYVKPPCRVNVSLGRVELVPRHVLDRLLRGFVPGEHAEMDDLWFSAQAFRASVFIRLIATDGFTNFAEQPGVGYCMRPGHYDQREREFSRLFHAA